ncbi:MAG TPA: FAD binding domain-containing protein [Anaerolineales bacterium]|nr:FAD binding domain-containing protein [Anaerolineales bacterium]
MIVEYHRPKTVEEALSLLSRNGMLSIPMGGGSGIDRSSLEPIAVVDLQDLGLNTLRVRGNFLDLGATVTLQALLDFPRLQPALLQAIRHEANYNLRHVATVAGTLLVADGRSPFTTAMLALDARLALRTGNDQGKEEKIGLGDLLPIREERLPGRLITLITIPHTIRLAYTYVARTPADRPIVCAVVAAWPSGRTRVALGGFGSAPLLAMDGPEAKGAEIAAQNTYSQAGDEWATAEYRQEVAGVLVRRCMEEISSQ